MSIGSDLKILYHLMLSPIKGRNHQERLESFYSGQAREYDSFRAGLLHGRKEMYAQLPIPDGGVWVEMGGGTGSNLEYLGEDIRRLGQVYVVDLSPSLLKVAAGRVQERGWTNVTPTEADVTRLSLGEQQADVITFSYSLTMIPDWYLALERAYELLKPGGTLGVVDFYVARKYPQEAFQKHWWSTRWFWSMWFASDNVFLSADHVPYLHQHFEPISFEEKLARIKYFPLARVPYYSFIGRKKVERQP